MSAHTVIFEHTDSDWADQVRVEHIEEGAVPRGRRLLIDARNGGEGDRVRVALDKDDALRLAKAITDALETEQELTVPQLEAMDPLDKVADGRGNEWAKTTFGDWYYSGVWRNVHSHELVRVYGPIKAVRA